MHDYRDAGSLYPVYDDHAQVDIQGASIKGEDKHAGLSFLCTDDNDDPGLDAV